MSITTRLPCPALRPFVRRLWVSDGDASPRTLGDGERVLPSGEMHMAVRLSAVPFRFLRDESDALGHSLGFAVVAGARIQPYFKDVSTPACSVGAQLLPGASGLLFGVPAVELSGAHVPLGALWSGSADELHERLAEVRSPRARLDILEASLTARITEVRGIHPAVSHALERFRAGAPVGEVVEETGYSHRHFIDLFRTSVGLAPKVFCRVRRFQRALVRVSLGSSSDTEVALETGYSDQAHLIRDFREFAGLTPGAYRRAGARRPGHVPLDRST